MTDHEGGRDVERSEIGRELIVLDAHLDLSIWQRG